MLSGSSALVEMLQQKRVKEECLYTAKIGLPDVARRVATVVVGRGYLNGLPHLYAPLKPKRKHQRFPRMTVQLVSSALNGSDIRSA